MTDTLPTSPATLFQLMDELNLKYRVYDHEPIFTVEEGLHLKDNIPGTHCRNLFLRDKKKKMFLVVAANETEIDLKKLPELIDSGRLSFGSGDRLWENLGIKQGSVNPFCIVNDNNHNVRIILDAHMMAQDLVNYHPMDNAQTIGLSPEDLVSFIKSTHHEPEIVDLSAAAPDV